MTYPCPDCHGTHTVETFETHECPSRPLFRDYEYQVIADYRERYSAIAYPWPIVPTDILLRSGYIKDIGKTRRRRLASGALRDYGMDGIGVRPDGGCDGLQAKRWTQGTLSGEALGTFSAASITILHENPLNGVVLYHAPGSRVCQDVMCCFDYVPQMRVHELAPARQEDKLEQTQLIEPAFTPSTSQQQALQFLTNQKSGMCLLAMACSTGKTTVVGWHAAACGFTAVIIAAPLIASAEQGLKRLSAFLPDHQHIAYWSGSCSIQGITAFLDTGKLQEALAPGNKVLIATTYESACHVQEALQTKKRNGPGTIVILDEAHNIRQAEDDSARKLAFEGTKLRKTVLVTATPLASMWVTQGIPGTNMPSFKYSMREAIAAGEICDYTITVPLVCDQAFRPVELTHLDSEDWDATGRAIFHAGAMHHEGAQRSIVYCNSIAQCRQYSAAFTEVCKKYLGLPCWCGEVTCQQTASQRAAMLHQFRERNNKLHILVSVRVLDEALDIPCCDSVFFTSPGGANTERAELRAIQRISRATRKDPANPHKIARAYLWADLEDNDDINNLLWLLRENDLEIASRVRVHSSRYDVAVSNTEVTNLCRLELNSWLQKFQVLAINPREMVELKVQWLIANFPKVRPHLQASLTLQLADQSYSFKPGSFVQNIANNWITGAKPKTWLTENDKDRLETGCVWLEAVIQEWQAAAKTIIYKPSTDKKVGWMLAHCKQSRPERSAEIFVVVDDGSYVFKAGTFVNHISNNWVPGSKAHTKLSETQKNRLYEGCKWLQLAVEGWVASADNKSYRPSVAEKVNWMLLHCAHKRPSRSAKVLVHVDGGGSYDFNAGDFLDKVRSNWVMNKTPNTLLTEEQKERLQAGCKWLSEAITNWQAAAADSSYRPSVAEKVDWLVQHYPQVRPVQSAEIAVDVAGNEYLFSSGQFLSDIYNNWIHSRKPNTRLTDTQKARLEVNCSWMTDAIHGWKVAASKRQDDSLSSGAD